MITFLPDNKLKLNDILYHNSNIDQILELEKLHRGRQFQGL